MSAATDHPYWMPFTANRDFNLKPRVINGASGHWYTMEDGTRLYDTFSGLWTCGVGHCHPKIVEAVQRQVAELDYAVRQVQIESRIVIANNDFAKDLGVRFGASGTAERNGNVFVGGGGLEGVLGVLELHLRGLHAGVDQGIEHEELGR